ncbi:ELMO domain-containing protein [Citrus sinensis]|uniref:ELMO domain-containing protein n=1 Tax=Citrus sinensis TaxID=2711 RepID=A0ACB8LGM0_CITSI|nr:ELMO domain-containing protein [Citrus sinensis]
MIFKITCKIVYGHNKQRVGNVVISSEPVSENSDRDIHLPFSPLPHLLQFHSCRVTVDVIEEMRVFRSQGGCVAIRTLSPSSSINRYSHAHGSAPGPAASGRNIFFLASVLCACAGFVAINGPCKVQAERLRRLKHRMKVYFDASRPDHQEALRALWAATYPDQELHGLISDQWKEMGWQGKDPSTDFRGAGFISLENLLFFAKTFSTSFQRLLRKQGGKRADWEYPFAVAGVNITFMLMQMLDLEATKPRTFVRSVFLQMLSALVILKRVVSDNEWAFDLLYCVAFVVMDKQWLERNATYMEFNDVLKSTRAQLERELLMDDVLQIEEMPSYSLLS